MPAVQAEGAPVVTFYGVTADDISLVFLESIGELYVDYDRVKPQVELDYRLTQGDDSAVSYTHLDVYKRQVVKFLTPLWLTRNALRKFLYNATV